MGPCRPEEQPVGKPSPFMKRRGPTLAGCGAIGAGFALPRDAGLETGAPGWALWHWGDWRWFRAAARCRSEDRRSWLGALACGDWRWFRAPARCRSGDRRSWLGALACGDWRWFRAAARCRSGDRRSWLGALALWGLALVSRCRAMPVWRPALLVGRFGIGGTGAGFALPRDAGLKTGAPGWALRHVGSC